MRLTTQQQRRIQELVSEHMGEDARVMVFGSRLSSRRKGGDVDLVIETRHRATRLEQAALKLALEDSLQLPVDLVCHQVGQPLTAFQSLARAQARPMDVHQP